MAGRTPRGDFIEAAKHRARQVPDATLERPDFAPPGETSVYYLPPPPPTDGDEGHDVDAVCRDARRVAAAARRLIAVLTRGEEE